LWAAAATLSHLGWVTVVAPREQSSGMGRSLPSFSDGIIRTETVTVNGQPWTVYAVGGSPAQAVLHGLLEILSHPPDLVVSGINYGENVGLGITVSGTVGAAMEAAAFGIPALAVSLETPIENHHSYSLEVDFSAAAHFAAFFARLLLEKKMPTDVDLLKVDVPAQATPETPWQVTRLSRQDYFKPMAAPRTSWQEPGRPIYRQAPILACEPDSDVYALRVKRIVSVTPLSLDLTSRTSLSQLESLLRE
ncbi:MAG: 5'/3'-nucleotidase SurE, partial [Anaerolineales bacterium]|nr:5'/3'-nucleotidase SurE [Anaerolineales bacterium]